jgi:GTP-binding protein HflX
VNSLNFDFSATIKALESEFAQLVKGRSADMPGERALLVGMTSGESRFLEMKELIRSAGIQFAGSIRQLRRRPHPKTVLGKGKLGQLVLEGMRRQAEVAIFDIDLKPAQARAFEDATGLKAVDRTQLILDIFAQRARSRDGKVQVELAQLRYSLPRLTEKDAGLSRLAGGIGGRGPGETVLEVGRRRIRDRIRKLEREISRLSKHRDLRRARRRRQEVPLIALVGYTNAGKTSLLNALTKSSVAAGDQLFVTLDPTTRRLRFPKEGQVLLIDTVGFLRDLPADLVTAFKATLEEMGSADLLLHVVDAADPEVEEKLRAVEGILGGMQLQAIPRLVALNKSDRLSEEQKEALGRTYRGIPVSAVEGTGLARLAFEMQEHLTRIRRGHHDSSTIDSSAGATSFPTGDSPRSPEVSS